jgi:hypothetical protein
VIFALPTFAIYAASHQRGCKALPSPLLVPLLTKPVWLFKILALHIPPPPSFYTNHLRLKATSMLISLRILQQSPHWIFYVSFLKCKKYWIRKHENWFFPETLKYLFYAYFQET